MCPGTLAGATATQRRASDILGWVFKGTHPRRTAASGQGQGYPPASGEDGPRRLPSSCLRARRCPRYGPPLPRSSTLRAPRRPRARGQEPWFKTETPPFQGAKGAISAPAGRPPPGHQLGARRWRPTTAAPPDRHAAASLPRTKRPPHHRDRASPSRAWHSNRRVRPHRPSCPTPYSAGRRRSFPAAPKIGEGMS